MDRQLKAMIAHTISVALSEATETATEKWVTAKELSEQISCFSPDWMKSHAHELPRTKAAYSNRWCYPLHKINRLMAEGRIKTMDVQPIV